MHLRKFSHLIFQHCPLFSAYSAELHAQAYDQFLAYKIRVPVRGAIMLNQDMTKAVLVKGWKKGAKWSFPRGKINKEEADLDCAVREVWEETGHDLRASDLVLPEAQMKSISVTMREQSMMLYVFRGVPEDYPFEPQTRKEISRIGWYKLTDLPMLRRRKDGPQHPQAPAQDTIKDSSFYMVAPFLGPLKAWIKTQHRLDKQKARNSAQHLAPPANVPITDDEEVHQPTVEEMNVSHIPPPRPDDSFAELVARLSSSRHASDALPEVSPQPMPEQPMDQAEQLKRLLSVGSALQSPSVEVPGQHHQQQANPLLALFQQGNTKTASPQPSLPQTPFDQFIQTPIQPQSPHVQHHPRPPQMNSMPPPPQFGFPPQYGPFHGPPPAFNGMHSHIPQQHFMPPPPPNSAHFQSPQHVPHQYAPQRFQQSNDGHASQSQSFQASQSQSFGAHGPGPAIPPASKLPAPNLNAHKLGLLNSFKAGGQQSPNPPPSQATMHVQSPPIVPRPQHEPPRHQPNELASPHFQSPALDIQPAQPKPRSAHQDSLLTLFRNKPPIPSPEPAELSALPVTPGYAAAQPASKPSRTPNQNLLDMFGAQPKRDGITSATVRGPVNAPDFDTMKKNTMPVSNSSRGPSPATFVPQQILKRDPSVSNSLSNIGGGRNGVPVNVAEIASAPQATFKPQILKQPQQNASPSPGPASTPTTHARSLLDMFKSPSPQPPTAQYVTPAPKPAQFSHANTLLEMFKSPSPQPLTAQSAASAPKTAHANTLLDMFKSPSPQPPTAQPAAPAPKATQSAHANTLLDMFKSPSPQLPTAQSAAPLTRSPAPQQSEPASTDQKSTLLALFNKPSPKPEGARIPTPLRQTHSPVPPTRSPLPPTTMSPVSPLQKGSQAVSPADFASRSRISSIGDASAPNIVIPPTSHPGEDGLGGQPKSSIDEKSPVDKAFLLGFLSDVARRGR